MEEPTGGSHGDSDSSSTRLRKNRNRFTIHDPPKTRMSEDRLLDTITANGPPADLARVVGWFTGQPDARERFRWVLRDSLDELLDGQRTGRWCYQHLTKTEKTYLGTAIEINMTREFDLADGHHLDWHVAGTDLDCKFSKGFGGWEIPMEMYRCADHGAQSGAEDHPALLLWMDDDNSRWAAGIVLISDAILQFRRDGTRAYNRDNKRKISPEGLRRVHWLWGGVSDDLPENLLLHMDPAVRSRIFGAGRSGQRRINALLREMTGRLITRATVLTVAQQDDSMKRARDARLNSNLGREGFLVLGHQEADPHVARLLGLPIPAKGEFVSCRVTPVDGTDPRPKAFLADRWWSIADPSDPVVTTPSREDFKRSSPDLLAHGPPLARPGGAAE